MELSLAAGDLNYSTITGGTTATSAPAALNCAATLHVTASIIWAPVCVDGATPCDEVPTGCTYVSSIVSNATAPSGTTNSNPMFVNEQIGNYHIQPTSPARDAVSTGPTTDFEGDARPGGSAFDIGADEIP